MLPAAAPAQRFEVASLKPSVGAGRGGVHTQPGGERYIANQATLKVLIMAAYRVRYDQVTGGPSWIESERYDLNAKAERPSTADEFRVMLQNLLAERFHLGFHRAAKEGPVYVLTVDSGGMKLKPHDAPESGIEMKQPKPFHMQWSATAVGLDEVAWRLSQALDRPVVNHTELKGGYDFELSYTAEPPPNLPPGVLINGEPIDMSGPNVFEALRKQLGLRLEGAKAPVDTIVVDRAEKPAAN